ncbi:MAG: cation:proton antiporter [Proteobacteria bacterium]|nr:cation:proton antiporter [Pseudomonadota bacterium]
MQGALGFLVNLSVSLGLALVLGLLTQRLRLSPIVGYLLAGIVVGPHTPGFVGDPKMAHDLAEVGVILIMFGVGLHFNFIDFLAVRRIAIPGSLGQILVASTLGTIAALSFGMGAGAGLVIGIAISVASTVVLVRVLEDNDLFQTNQGHIAIGWLILEDIFTVFVLVLLPAMASIWKPSEGGGGGLLITFALTIAKFAGLSLLVVVVGRKAVPRLLTLVARTRSRELFTLTILSLALAIATGSAALFDVSMALGAFLAGIVVGQTEVSHQAAADALPMRDAFAVLFFVSIGMLFDPQAIFKEPRLLFALLGIIILAKPLTAFLIIWTLRYSVRTAITVALALAQIGEFSFLLAYEAMGLGMLSADGQSLLVACAVVSIAINPLLFRAIDPLEKWLRNQEKIWRILSRRSEFKGMQLNLEEQVRFSRQVQKPGIKAKAVIVGYGPVGQTASRILKDFDIPLVIIDMNLDTVRKLMELGQAAIYGDASRHKILEAAGIQKADYLLVTIPDVLTRTTVILTAKELNPELHVFARARYLQERAWLEEIGVTDICIEEAETAIGLAILLLREVGADGDRIQKEIQKIRAELGMRRRNGQITRP